MDEPQMNTDEHRWNHNHSVSTAPNTASGA
jgi:hypothetical protein